MSYQLDLERQDKALKMEGKFMKREIAMRPVEPEQGVPDIPGTEALTPKQAGFIQQLADASPQDEQTIEQESQSEDTQQVAPQQTIQEQPIEREQARNFRELREQKEALARERDAIARERDETLRRLKELESKAEDFNINPDDLVEGKHLQKLMKESRENREQLARLQQQAHMNMIEARIKSIYPDFDNVVNAANIETLKIKKPHAAAILASAVGDPEAALMHAYDVIKSNNIVTNHHQEYDKQRATANVAKPRPANTLNAVHSESPLSKAQAFSKEPMTQADRDFHYREMRKAIQGG